VLHGCIHVVLGPDTLTEEFGPMAYEYACARILLIGKDYAEWRRDVADYGFEWGDGEDVIGEGDEVFHSHEWITHCDMDARRRGWLDCKGEPVRFCGIHAAYRACPEKGEP